MAPELETQMSVTVPPGVVDSEVSRVTTWEVAPEKR